jgi:hypothetical protein
MRPQAAGGDERSTTSPPAGLMAFAERHHPSNRSTPSYGAEQQKTNKMSGECQRADSFDSGTNPLLVHARFSFEKPSKYLLVPSIAASLFVYNPATI